ncbi:MAG: aromatic ring-hydroxylating dioxygenase subunit alpha [SAR202 cluster bacterium]|nr:(Fe-S)-binding protein [Chloroflexota bacterium]MQG79407.1 aromatic ring-hydroxylating dioxygenase subunit alpha [SAR202 cluster bacterium]
MRMATRAPFLSTRYGGYYHREIPQEDAELTRIGPGTPCGEYLRRFWQPVTFSDDLKDLPVAMKILGEELVAFRDFSGRIGLVEAHCPHRGTSLEFGLVSERGIRCCYHGWLFDVDGAILETPGEPEDSTLKDRLCHGAYPTHEYNGTIFAYMGPPDQMPPFPLMDTYEREGYRLMPGKKYNYPCNWLQILENAMDPVHTSFLHTIVSGSQFTDEFGVIPELDFIETPAGMIYIATRRMGDNIWVRMVENIMPNLQQVAPIWEDGKSPHDFDGPMMSRWIVPQDDTNTMLLEFRHIAVDEEGTPAWWIDREQMLPAQLPITENLEDQQRQPSDYEAQVSQRPIAIHGMEHLGATDRGITMFRKLVKDGIKAVQEGRDPDVLSRDDKPVSTYCNDTVVYSPPVGNVEEDIKAMREVGRKLAEDYIANPPLSK